MNVFRKNKLRELMNKNEATVGTHVHTSWPGMMEVIGYTGEIDYVEFSGQYAPYDLYALDDMARAAQLFDMPTMMKVDPEPKMYLAQKAIGAGFQSILFADLRTVKEVEEAVSAIRAPPRGRNGCWMHRVEGYLLSCGTQDFTKYCEEIVLALMLEKKSLYDQLEDVMNLDDVDMIQFGPCDFAMSIGHAGQQSHPKVVEAEKRIIKMSLKYDKHPRVEISHPEEAEDYVKMGVKDFAIGWDVSIIHEFLKKNGNKLRRMIEK